MDSKHPAAYTLVKGTGSLQRTWYLYHRLGIWSNILVSARYTCTNGQELSQSVVIEALRHVVQAHPALWHVFVQKPSPNRGNHELHTARLPTIDLEKCIEVLDCDQNSNEITSDDLERAHNEWWWTDDEPDRPLWKLLVKGNNAIFVYHHSLGDGISGMVFHREFLDSLNSPATEKTMHMSRPDTLMHADENVQPPIEPEDVWEGKDSILELIWTQLVWLFVKFFYGNNRIYGDLPPSKPHLKSATAVAKPEDRTVTRISSYRIPAEDMSEILAACRNHQTTFTPLLITMFTIVLATEFYPNAKIGATRFNFDLRPSLPMSRVGGGTANGTFVNAAGSWQLWHKLRPFRQVLVTKGDGKETSLDCHSVWELVKDYKKEMTHAISGKAIRNWIGVKRLGTDLENMVDNGFPSISLLLKPTFSVSNIGSFDNAKVQYGGKSTGLWLIDDMQFSAGAVNGNQGTHGAIFHVCGVKGGDTVITATYEDGIVPRQMADEILDRTVTRMLEIV
ncbi:peroxidase family [Fusarium napiforme]|uniref:Peroxidase family n=1 Tax=Fusarium napiforme TaxID=42672 RepID=A0A8H5I4D4_9HYPO|nr:peroxidase family [Fusarium napiforme]